MFQTDPVLWLQSFASDWLTTLVHVVSGIGASTVYRIVAIAIVFGVDLRGGLMLLHLIFWNYLLIGALKLAFALPRPSVVDPRVQSLGTAAQNPTLCPGPDASSFWSGLAPDVLARCRAMPRLSLGFPSGHVAGATSFYYGGALLLRCSALALAGVAMVPLMGVSRMYLGVHFLADVVGGVVVGAIGIAGAAALRSRPRLAAAVLLAVAAAAILAQPLAALAGGRLVGAVAATLVLLWRGLPPEGGSLGARVARVVLAYGLYFGGLALVPMIAIEAGLGESMWAAFATGALPVALCLWGTVSIGLRLRLFAPSSPPAPA